MQKHVKVRDVVIAMTCTTVGTPSNTIFRELNYSPCADYGLLEAAVAAARTRDCGVHVGGIYSSDTFYDERPDLTEQMTRHGILASRWRRPSFTPLPRAMAFARWGGS